ncbi:RNA polymerase sigma factor [Bacillus sp. 03113]|uniref:RNA polymerase sigma factor n=1 Tax=Bacillus sp. 03113 TaxID=2578211 RepID=UPI0015E8879A|nr:sigma factor-like helix-turn-helix DNA-binding protein [Bacillus sp. 03113]
MRRVDVLCEAYYQEIGIMPKVPALERLSYITMFDELTDNHPDKMTREEYPILSEDQGERRQFRERVAKDMSIGDRRFFGRRKVSYTDDNGAPQVRNSKLVGNTDVMESVDLRLDLLDAIDKANLTTRQRQSLWLVYGEEMTQEEVGFVMGISQPMVAKNIDVSLSKLRKIYGI